VAALKKFGLINYIGARKKGHYEMTQKGIDFIESSLQAPVKTDPDASLQHRFPVIEQAGIPIKAEARDLISAHFNQADL
jgi:hypothetical protein